VRAFCESCVLFHMSHLKLHFALHTSHCTLHTPHYTLHTPHFTLCTALFALHTSLHTALLRLHTSHSTLHTSQSTLHTSHFSLLSSHSTLHTSHSTLHTALFTPHTHFNPFQVPSPSRLPRPGARPAVPSQADLLEYIDMVQATKFDRFQATFHENVTPQNWDSRSFLDPRVITFDPHCTSVFTCEHLLKRQFTHRFNTAFLKWNERHRCQQHWVVWNYEIMVRLS